MFHSIQEILQKHAIGGILGKDQSKYVSLSLFLTDIIFALKTDLAMLVVLPFPKLEDYYGIISPHILSAVGNPLPGVTPIEVLTPIT